MLGRCCTPAPWEPKYLCSELFRISPYVPPHLGIYLSEALPHVPESEPLTKGAAILTYIIID